MKVPGNDVTTSSCLIVVWWSKSYHRQWLSCTNSPCTHQHMRFLCSGSGKHVKRNSFIVVRLGHPLHWLVVASCGSNAAKRLRKHFAQLAQLPKSTNHQIWDMSNKNWFSMATTQNISNEQPYGHIMNLHSAHQLEKCKEKIYLFCFRNVWWLCTPRTTLKENCLMFTLA